MLFFRLRENKSKEESCTFKFPELFNYRIHNDDDCGVCVNKRNTKISYVVLTFDFSSDDPLSKKMKLETSSTDTASENEFDDSNPQPTESKPSTSSCTRVVR